MRGPLTLRGVGAVLLALGCFVLANQFGLVELVMFGVLLLALLLLATLLVFVGHRRAEVSRVFVPETVAAGAQVDVVVRVRMLSAGRVPAMRWDEALPDDLVGDASGVFPGVPAGWSTGDRSVELRYRVHAAHRGVHWIGPLRLRATDPFGLVRRTTELGDASRLVVTPAAVDLASMASAPGRTGGARPTPTNRFGQGSDDLVARPWAPGDSMRRIHWRASAHRDELMVRQEERETSPEATVVFDRAVARFSPEAAERAGGDPDFEVAVTACVSAVARLVHDGFAVEVIDTDGLPLCDAIGAGDETAAAEMRAAFAEVRARSETALTSLAGRFAGEITGPVVLVTGRLDAAGADAIAPVAFHTSLPLLLAVGATEGVAASAGWQGGAVTDEAGIATAWAAERAPEASRAS